MKKLNGDDVEKRMNDAIQHMGTRVTEDTVQVTIAACLQHISSFVPDDGMTDAVNSLVDALASYLIHLPTAIDTTPTSELTECVHTICSNIVAIAEDCDISISTRTKKYKVFKTAITDILIELETGYVASAPTSAMKTGRLPLEALPSNDKTANNAGVDFDSVLAASDFTLVGADVQGTYCYVSHGDLIGIWYHNGKRLYQLTNCFLHVVSVVTMVPDSSIDDFTIQLELTNVHGFIIPVTLTKEQLEKNRLASIVRGYAKYPTSKIQQQQMEESINLLALRDTVQHQLKADSLGWYTSNNKRVWINSNGCETVDGFKDATTAPILPPTLPTNANGYTGEIVAAPTDEIMELLLNQLNPHVQVIIAALLGTSAHIMLPVGSHPGVSRFVTEIIGYTRHGKSVLVNYLLSLFGTGFEYRKGTLLNNEGGSGKGDSALGRGIALNSIKYHMGTDYDNKIKPDDSRYEAAYNIRNSTNNMYADDSSSIVSTRNQQGKNRPQHQGALIRTGETDYAVHMAHKQNESSEHRVCTFVWGCECAATSATSTCSHISNEQVSKQINKRRKELYSWGVSYRRWLMSHSDDELLQLLEAATDKAYELVHVHSWEYDLHPQQTEILIVGLLMWQQFLLELHSTSFMIEWVNTIIPALIANRVERNQFVTLGVQKTKNADVANHVLDAIRHVLDNYIGYVKTQKNLMFTHTDIAKYELPVSLMQLGYREAMKGGGKSNVPTGVHVGYYVHNGRYIAFTPKLLLDKIREYGEKRNLKLGSSVDVQQSLENAGYITSTTSKFGKKQYGANVRIDKTVNRYLCVPVDVLFPVCDEPAINEDDEQDTSNTPTPDTNTPDKQPIKLASRQRVNKQVPDELDALLAGDIK